MRFHHLDIPELHHEGFKKDPLGKIKLYGKSDPAPAPDYEAQAEKKATGDRAAAEYTTKANRINQFTPYGSLTYQYTPQYTTDPITKQKVESGAGWTQRMNLTPEAQRALDEQLALNTKYGQVANIGFDKARELFENPQLDESMLPKRAIDVGQTAQQAIMSRLQPQLQQQEEALRQQLANQGIGLGSTAFGREQAIAGQRRNDLELQAALQGINLDQANRVSALEEQAYLQDRPLNLINALRSGNQVQAPQFQQFAQQNAVQGPDYLSAAKMQYDADVEGANAKNAQSSGIGSLVGGIAGGMFGGPMGASLGSSIGGGLFSDERLKTNIKRVGTLDELGVGLYSYNYVWGGPTHVGVMAQELEKVKPEAVFEVDGYKAVDYGRL